MARETTVPIDPMFTARWSPRAFDGTPLPEATLRSFFEAARWAPSASNHQPWRFVHALAGTPAFEALLGALVPANQAWARHAAALVVVASATTTQGKDGAARANPWHAFDAGAAWMSFALQAHQAGWSTHGMGGFDADALRTVAALPADVVPHAVVAVGRRGDPGSLPDALRAREQPSDRAPLSASVFEGRFDGATG